MGYRIGGDSVIGRRLNFQTTGWLLRTSDPIALGGGTFWGVKTHGIFKGDLMEQQKAMVVELRHVFLFLNRILTGYFTGDFTTIGT